jgi:hypothetical protein
MSRSEMDRAMKAFNKDLMRFAKKTKNKTIPQSIRGMGLQALKMLMTKSPVDDGVFRGNWNVGINEIDDSIDDLAGSNNNRYALDSYKFNEGSNRIGSVRVGDSINISNALPYAMRIEHGWSDQAPSGVVRTTLMELTFWLKAKNKKV